jgi:hypothetical protein
LERFRNGKAREMSRTGCYDIYITTPEGRNYHSSEFADLPRTPVGERPFSENPPTQQAEFDIAFSEIDTQEALFLWA